MHISRFEGRTALITGGGHGIGRACARRLSAEGAAVVVADIDHRAAERTTAELIGAGDKAVSIRCDITDPRSVADAVGAAVSSFGGIDVLVNTAGGDARPDDPDDPDDDHWVRMLDLNLLGVVRLIRAVLPHLLVAPSGGSVVTIGSINGLIAARSEPYPAAKAQRSGHLACDQEFMSWKFSEADCHDLRARFA
jgi:meso-butanediol dehydrogenase / (S,S)-butanediol dehydrogenase / diacetyl reductase